MSSAGFQKANSLAVLFAGRRPQWEEQDAYTGAPATAAAGVALQDSVVTLLVVALRSEVHRRFADVTMGVLNVAATYTVTINGNAITFAAPAGEDVLLIGLKDAVLADAVVGGAAGANQIVTAQCLSATGAITVGGALGGDPAKTLQVIGTVNADWTIDIGATLTGTLACVADAKTASIRIYEYPKDSTVLNSTEDPPDAWTMINAAAAALDYRGVTERVETGGLARAYVEVHTIAGAGDGATVTHRIHGAWLGPCVEES
jgi:hypothetical protein